MVVIVNMIVWDVHRTGRLASAIQKSRKKLIVKKIPVVKKFYVLFYYRSYERHDSYVKIYQFCIRLWKSRYTVGRKKNLELMLRFYRKISYIAIPIPILNTGRKSKTMKIIHFSRPSLSWRNVHLFRITNEILANFRLLIVNSFPSLFSINSTLVFVAFVAAASYVPYTRRKKVRGKIISRITKLYKKK